MNSGNMGIENYLSDVLALLIGEGRQARAKRDASRHDDSSNAALARAFEEGRTLAYYEVVSSLLNRLDIYGIPPETVGVPKDFNADRELL
jgi:hypothetical protein